MILTRRLAPRQVREGGYDPVTLRDRRTGDEVGPLPDSQIGHKVESIAGSLAKQHMTGAHVAYALGSDRYGDPDAGNVTNVKVHQAHVDHVSMIMQNEGRVEAGGHDLEEREKVPSNVEKLMDLRYADEFEDAAEMQVRLTRARPSEARMCRCNPNFSNSSCFCCSSYRPHGQTPNSTNT